MRYASSLEPNLFLNIYYLSEHAYALPPAPELKRRLDNVCVELENMQSKTNSLKRRKRRLEGKLESLTEELTVIKDQMPIYREQKKQLLYGLKKHSYSALGMSSVMCVVSTVVRCDTEYDVWTDKVEGGGASMIDGV